MHNAPPFQARREYRSHVGLAESLRQELREIIAVTVKSRPERVLIRIPFDKSHTLSSLDAEDTLKVLRDIDGYVGAAMPNHPETVLPWPYLYSPYPASRVIEALLLTDELKARPLETRAKEAAAIAHDIGHSVDVDSTFAYSIPESLLEYITEADKEQRVQFRQLLEKELGALGYSIHHGSYNERMEIRKDKIR